jgi:hypothetical protein
MPNILSIEDRIQQYIDGEGSREERAFVENMISMNQKWEEQYTALLELQDMLQTHFEPMEPSMRFGKNVMEEIARVKLAKPVRVFINPWVFRILGGILGCFLMGIFIYAISQSDFSNTNKPFYWQLNSFTFPKIDWTNTDSEALQIPLFMIVTIFGLYLADKTLQANKNQG